MVAALDSDAAFFSVSSSVSWFAFVMRRFSSADAWRGESAQASSSACSQRPLAIAFGTVS
jgi:hypothetical protein